MEAVKKYIRILLNIIIPVLMIAIVCIIGPKLLRFFMPFVIGGIIAMIANPVVRVLERRLKIVRKHSSVLIVVAVLAGVIAVLYVFLSKLIVEISGLLSELPDLYQNVQKEIQSALQSLEYLFVRLPLNVQHSLSQLNENLGQYISMAIQKIAFPTVSIAGNLARGIPTVLVYTVVIILSSYFFIAERDKMDLFSDRYFPSGVHRYLIFLREDMKHLLGGYFLAQFRIMFVVAAILAVGFIVLGVEYGLFLAILVAVLDFLPVFGTGTVLIPWALLKFITGDYFVATGLVLLYVLTQVVRQVIQPKIVGDSMGLPPLATLLLMYLGFKLSGLSGMILAVPIGLFAINLYHFGLFDSMIENIKILITDIDHFRKNKSN